MIILCDSNILLRILDQAAVEHQLCVDALAQLDSHGHDLAICAQVMIEFWAVATRPVSANGLGESPASAASALDQFVKTLIVLPEPPAIAFTWRRLITQYSVISKQAHDARLAALVLDHAVDRLLTLNTTDFAIRP